jgi:hypothetical protein
MGGEAKIIVSGEDIESRLWRVNLSCVKTDNHEVRSFDNARHCPSSSIFCSVVREINKINERELELGVGSASWHDEYKGGS